MNIVLAQQNYRIGDFDSNLEKIIAGVEEARAQKADLVVFSELSICGYPPRDFLEFEDFIEKCESSLEVLKAHAHDIAILVGAPSRNPSKDGKKLFNSAWFLEEGSVKAVVHKTLLPTYDVFDEHRYFEPGYDWQVVEFKGKRLAITICEDIWNLGDNPLYRICPMDKLMDFSPDVMLNLSASPFDYDQEEKRLAVIRANALKYGLPIYYCNAIGSQTEIVFDGSSLILDASGSVHSSFPPFKEHVEGAELNTLLSAPSQPGVDDTQLPDADSVHLRSTAIVPARGAAYVLPFDPERHIDRIHDALVLGIKDYFAKMNFTKAILGASGGIDSAVTAVLACEALGPENVQSVLMPSPFSTGHSVDDAVELSRNLGNPYALISISDMYEDVLKALHPYFEGTVSGLAEENIQPRIRSNILMSLANKFGYILLNTSNKSELSAGYGTLYGDMAGGLSVLGDLYKTQVYALARYVNRNSPIIPHSILTKPPSAELRPDQKDTDSLPEYMDLDPILYEYIERRRSPDELKSMGYNAGLVDRVLKLVNTSEYKRNQFCPIIRVSCKAFGVGRRVPIVACYLS